MKPVKFDVSPGGEWLVPAAKRWLEQAKRRMGRVGSKFIDMGSLGQVTLTWGPALDYVRIAVKSGAFMVGYSHSSGGNPAYLQLYSASGDITETISLPSGYVQFRSDTVRLSPDGKVVSVSLSTSAGSGHYLFKWTKELGLELLFGGIFSWGLLSFDTSEDGSTVVGYGTYDATPGLRAFKLRDGAFTKLDRLSTDTLYAVAYACDNTGDVVAGISIRAGTFFIPDVYRAVMWDNSTTPTHLGYALPAHNNSEALGISRVNKVIVGTSYQLLSGGSEVAGRTAFIWTAGAGMVPLYASGTYTNPSAVGVSDNGSIIAGYARSAPGYRHAVVWVDGTMYALDPLPGVVSTDTWSARAVSANGNVIVGQCDVAGVRKPVMWVRVEGAQYEAVQLPTLEGLSYGAITDVA